MPGPADTYLAQHPELFRNKGAMTKDQLYDSAAQKKYGSKSTSVLPPEFTQEQLADMYVDSVRNGTPWLGPLPNQNADTSKTGTSPQMESIKQAQKLQPEPEKMGTKGPDTYNKAHGLIKDAQDKAGIVQGSEYTQAKREQEKMARELDNAKGFEHVAKYTPNQNPDAVKSAQDNVKDKKDEIDEIDTVNANPKGPETNKPEGPEKEETNKPEEPVSKGTSFKGLSSSFYRDIAAALKGQPTGNIHDANAAMEKEQAQDYRNAAANRDMEAQASQQIANQNPYAEAGKMASVQNDAQNRQNVKKAGVLGAGAALARATNTPDVMGQMSREDQQRNVAAQRRETADEMRYNSSEKEGEAAQDKVWSRDNDNFTDTVGYLSQGGNVNDAANGPGLFDKAKAWWEKNKDLWQKDEPAKPGIDYNSDPRFQKSDERIKDIVTEYAKGLDNRLANARMGWIKEDYESDGMPSKEDFMWLLDRAGKLNHNGREYDLRDDASFEGADDSVLDAYANHIKNYVYTYKPEATEIDQSIDPNQEHIGPMAQDIEQVNPACVKETPEGVKTVDTARLAMMNAGAIGDLARQMAEMSAKLNALVQGE